MDRLYIVQIQFYRVDELVKSLRLEAGKSAVGITLGAWWFDSTLGNQVYVYST